MKSYGVADKNLPFANRDHHRKHKLLPKLIITPSQNAESHEWANCLQNALPGYIVVLSETDERVTEHFFWICPASSILTAYE